MTSLQTLYAFYAYSEQSVLPPDEVRAALSALHAQKDGRFALGQQDDANECFEAILLQIHRDDVRRAGGGDDDGVCSPPCAAHHCFGLSSFDQYECAACRASSEPQVALNFVYRVGVIELLNARPRAGEQGSERGRGAATRAGARSKGQTREQTAGRAPGPLAVLDKIAPAIGAAASSAPPRPFGDDGCARRRGEPRVQRLLPVGVAAARAAGARARARARAAAAAAARRAAARLRAQPALEQRPRRSGAQLAQLLRLVSLELRVPSVFAARPTPTPPPPPRARRTSSWASSATTAATGSRSSRAPPAPPRRRRRERRRRERGGGGGGGGGTAARPRTTWLLFDDAQVPCARPARAPTSGGRRG